MKKVLFMPDIMSNVFKSMNLEMEHIPWEQFNVDTVGDSKFKLPKQDQQLLIDVNLLLSGKIGLESSVSTGYLYQEDNEEIELFNKIANIPNENYRELFKIDLITDGDYILFTFSTNSVLAFKKMTKELAKRILDDLGRFIPAVDLVKTDLARTNFIY